MNDAGKSRRLTEVAKDRLTEDLVPIESYISIGMPIMHSGGLATAHFSAQTQLLADKSNMDIYPPNYRAYISWQSEVVAGLEPLQSVMPVDQMQSLGLLLSEDLAGYWTDEKDELFARARAQAYEAIDVLGPSFVSRAPEPEAGRQLLNALGHLVSSIGLGLYREVSPDFFIWLESTAAAAPPAPTATVSRFCANCGTPRSEGRFCTNCGTPFAD